MEVMNNVGLGSSMYALLEPDDTIDDSQGPSKEDPKSGTCLRNMKSWDEISRKMTQIIKLICACINCIILTTTYRPAISQTNYTNYN